MPNRREHMETAAWVGGAVGFFSNIIKQTERKRINPDYQFNLGELVSDTAVCATVGTIGGALPDMLEPASHPGHRDIFHSWTVGTLAVVGVKKLNERVDVSPNLKMVINTATAGYVSHLVLDGRTPSGLPLLTRS